MAGEADTTTETTAAGTAAATSITGEAPAGQTQSSEAGQGSASEGEGQGAGKDEAVKDGASADGEDTQAGEGGETTAGAPEQYADFALPDGYQLDSDMLESVTTFAKAHNLTQQQAQGLVDLGAKQAAQIVAQFTAEAQANPVMLASHWASEWSKLTAADAEYGGKNLTTNMAQVAKVFGTFGTPELGEFLNKTGLAHHPELIRFMHRVGKAVGEDTLVTPSGGQGAGQGDAKKFYPNTPGMK